MATADAASKPNAEFSVSDGRLIMTFQPEALNVCKHCPDLHVLVLEVASKENIQQLALGLLHLGEHIDDGR